MKLKIPENVADNKDIVFDLLAPLGVKSFNVNFDGSGDSGSVEESDSFVFKDKKNEKKLLKEVEKLLKKKVDGGKVSAGTRFGPNGPETMWEEDVTLETMISGICYDSLEQVCGGWEINEGSHGSFNFDVEKRKVHLSFNERVLTENTSEFVF